MEEMSLSNRMIVCLHSVVSNFLVVCDDARIGASHVVFGLVTPLDHPPEAPCVFYIYIIYSTDDVGGVPG